MRQALLIRSQRKSPGVRAATLRAAATSGDSRFFLGTDSAPHLRTAKVTELHHDSDGRIRTIDPYGG